MRMWAWVSGPSVVNSMSVGNESGLFASSYHPGGRSDFATVDRSALYGLVYLYGGNGMSTIHGSNYLADLWAYRHEDNAWAYINGDSVYMDSNAASVFGQLGHFCRDCHPGNRLYLGGWADASSSLVIIFGGVGFDQSGILGIFNDVWAFNASSAQWAWAGGSSNFSIAGIYNDSAWFNIANVPGGRGSSIFWRDSESSMLLLYGGYGHDGKGNEGSLNDLWATMGPTVVCPSPPPTIITEIDPPYGPNTGSTHIIITGLFYTLQETNYTANFGDFLSATATRLNDTHMTCTTPSFPTSANWTVTIESMTSWFFSYSDPVLSSVTPAYSQMFASTSIIVTGSTFLPEMAHLFLIYLDTTPVRPTQLNSNQIHLMTPPFIQPVPVQLTIAPNGQQIVPNQSLKFTVCYPPQVKALVPSRGQASGETYNITVDGSNFLDTGIIQCRFGSSVFTSGWYINGNNMKCLAPQMPEAQIVPLEISLNGQQYTSNNIKFTFVEYFSELCRYQGELSIFVADRTELDLTYFPNLATNATIVATPQSDRYGGILSPIQLIDGDRCCKYTATTDGFKCGVIFAQRNQSATVVVDLGQVAHVNQLLSSWYKPCQNLPNPSYSISYRRSPSDEWKLLTTRITWSKNPCRTVPGDAGATAFCVDFFQPIEARQFNWTFHNSDDDFLVGSQTDGGWLYEVEVHGIFLSSPWQILCPDPVVVKSALNATVPPMSVILQNIRGENLQSKTSSLISISIDDPTQHLPTVNVLDSATLSHLFLIRPKVGEYRLDFNYQTQGLKGCNTTLTVTEGIPHELGIDLAKTTWESLVHTKLAVIKVNILDEAGNQCTQDKIQRQVTIKSLNGTGFWTMVSNEGCAQFHEVSLTRPAIGKYVFNAESPGIASCQLSVTVKPGPASMLSGEVFQTAARQSMESVDLAGPIKARMLDAGGNIPSHVSPATIHVRALNESATLNGTTSIQTDENGVAEFNDLKLIKPSAGMFLMGFIAAGLQDYEWWVPIVVGPPRYLSIRSTWPSEIQGQCDMKLPIIQVTVKDAGRNIVQNAPCPVSVKGASLGGNITVTTVNGIATFDDVHIINAKADLYDICFTSNGLFEACRSIKVIAGAAMLVIVDPESLSVEVLPQTSLGIITIHAADCLKTKVMNETTVRNLTITLDVPGDLLGPTQLTMANGIAVVDDLYLVKPNATEYTMVVSAAGLDSAVVRINVGPGPPHSLRVINPQGLESDNEKGIVVDVEVLDAGSNRVEKSVMIIASFEGGQVAATSKGGYAIFESLLIKGPRGGSANVLLSVSNSPWVNTTVGVHIRSCGEGMVTSRVDDHLCVCGKGRQRTDDGLCKLCAVNHYKAEEGDDPCTKCPDKYEVVDHEGAISREECRCRQDYYFNSTSESCLVCKKNADCTDGIISPKQGFWCKGNDSVLMLPCPNPNACLGGTGSRCATSYTGPLCSVCTPKPKFAKQGDVCYECYPIGWNIALLFIIIIFLFFILRFYVRKQMLGGRSAQTIVLKVIVSYVQVIAFVGAFRPSWGTSARIMFSMFGSMGNMNIFGLQPVDCVFSNANAYYWLLFYCMLLPCSFVIPWILYHLSRTRCCQAISQYSRTKRVSVSLRAKRGIDEYVNIVRRRSTISRSGLGRRSDAARTIDIVLWPFRLFFFSVLPGIPRVMIKGVYRCWIPVRDALNRMWNKMSGDKLEDGEVDMSDDDSLIDARMSRRISSVVDPQTVSEARTRAKSVGAVLFESDPMIGRSAMSATKSAFWILFFLFLPTIVKNCLEMFNCRADLAPEPRMYTDVETECTGDLYNYAKLGIIVVVFPLILTLLVYVVFKNAIIRKRRELVKYLGVFNLCWVDSMGYLRLPPNVDKGTAKLLRSEKRLLRRLRKYLFLFSGYKSTGMLFLWDLVIMGRKICIAAILVFAAERPMLQAVLALILFITSVILNLVFKPFDDDYARAKRMKVTASTLELISLVATIFTILVVVLDIHDANWATYLDIALIVVNGGPMILFVYLLFDALLNDLYTVVGVKATRQLHTEQAHNAACWWKKRVPFFEWGIQKTREVLDSEDHKVEMEEPLLADDVEVNEDDLNLTY